MTNTANDAGGGAFINAGVLDLDDTPVVSNTATTGHGGGIYAAGAGTSDVTNGTIENNTAGDRGGGLHLNGPLTMTDTAVNNNTAAGWGGGIYTSGAADTTVIGGQVANNDANSGDGGLYISGDLTLQSTSVMTNSSFTNGGGAFATGALVVTRTLVLDNQVRLSGGGAYTGDVVDIQTSRFINNTAGLDGGGLYAPTTGGQIINSIFARNRASSTSGAGMYVGASSDLDILHTDVASPTQAVGLQGIYAVPQVGVTVVVADSIVAGYGTGIENAGAGAVNEDYNLFDNNGANLAGVINSGGNSFNGSPNFVNPTPGVDDYHILLTSDAIDTGFDYGVTTDFDGDARPLAITFDIGADEVVPPYRDLAVVKDATPMAFAGEPITYVLTIYNNGWVTATNVVLTDTFPVPELTFARAITPTHIPTRRAATWAAAWSPALWIGWGGCRQLRSPSWSPCPRMWCRAPAWRTRPRSSSTSWT